MSHEDLQDEAQRRWGDTDAYSESARRTSKYSAEDFSLANKQAAKAVQEFIDAFAAGLPADSPEAASAAESHRQAISDWYYECSYEIHIGLAEMYLADDRFREHYDNQMSGLAQFIHDAILANALNKI